MDRWYVAQTRPREERTALTHLIRQGFTTFLPEYLRRRSHARRVETVRAPLFPGYLFISMDIALTRWRAIASTVGVSRLICTGERPSIVPDGVIESIRSRADDCGLIQIEPIVPFRPGDAVQVVSGAFADQIGLFQCATDEDRVVLLLDILGREIKVKLPLASVASYA